MCYKCQATDNILLDVKNVEYNKPDYTIYKICVGCVNKTKCSNCKRLCNYEEYLKYLSLPSNYSKIDANANEYIDEELEAKMKNKRPILTVEYLSEKDEPSCYKCFPFDPCGCCVQWIVLDNHENCQRIYDYER